MTPGDPWTAATATATTTEVGLAERAVLGEYMVQDKEGVAFHTDTGDMHALQYCQC